MKKPIKVGIYLTAIVLGIIVSPALAFSEVNGVKNSVNLTETLSTSENIKLVRIVGLPDEPFVPNPIEIKKGETVSFMNFDGSNGGTSHTVTSVKAGTVEPDGKFDSGVLKVGEKFQVNLPETGVYEYVDLLNPTIPGKITIN